MRQTAERTKSTSRSYSAFSVAQAAESRKYLNKTYHFSSPTRRPFLQINGLEWTLIVILLLVPLTSLINEAAFTKDATSYTCDENGNRLERTRGAGIETCSWDYENRLTELIKQSAGGVGNYAWLYDYRTRRVELAYAGDVTKVSFGGGTSVREFENSIASVDYVRGSDWGGGVGGILCSLRGGTPSFTHYNRRGDVTAKTDATGTVTYQAEYEAFGKRTVETGSTDDRQKSNTKDEDIPGYANEGFRFRDLETGTFISRDPAGFVDGPNLYTYVQQNPWTAFDPDGLWLETVWDAGNAIMGAVSAYNNFRSGNIGAGLVDTGGAVLDGLATVVPVVPGGVSTVIKAGRLADKAKDAAKAGDVVANGSGVVKAGDNAASATRAADSAPTGTPQKVTAGGESPGGPTAKDISDGGGSSSGGSSGGGSGGGDTGGGAGDRYSGRYADGEKAYRTNVPRDAQNNPIPDSNAAGAHSRLQPDAKNPQRTYSATEFDAN